jgi:hypothetical protein
MTIGTQELEIGKCVVGPVSVRVMQLEGYWPTQPLSATTSLTTMIFHSLMQEPVPQSIRILQLPMHQDLIERTGSIGVRCASENGLAEKVRCV